MSRILVALVALVCARFAAAEAFVINLFDVRMQLHRDGGMDVEERITVTFTEDRHGIFRFIPIDYETGKGVTRRMLVTGVSVTDGNGNGQKAEIGKEGPNLRIRIGNPKVYVSAGTQLTYVIRYHAFNMVNRFARADDWEPHAELYWNVTGDQWEVPIYAARFSLEFPNSPNGKGVRGRIFAGPYGSRAANTALKLGDYTDSGTASHLVLSSNRMTGERTAPLDPGSGLTVVLDVPANLIDEPTTAQLVLLYLLPNLGFGIPLLALLAMPILWLIYGRDPAAGPTVVQFEPPDGLAAPEAGAMLDEKVDPRDVASIIVSLATKGFLTIEVQDRLIGSDTTLRLTGSGDESKLNAHESAMLRYLRTAGDVIDETDMREHVAPFASTIRSTIWSVLVDRGVYRSSPETVRVLWVVFGLAITIALAALCVLVSPTKEQLPSIVGAIASAIIVIAFSKGMPRRTREGSKLLARVRGFEEFIRRAKEPELNWMSQKHPDMALFEEYLPYAVAFGLSRQWSRAFEGILTELPNWYISPNRQFIGMDFGRSLNRVTDNIASASTTPPRSSGASGGSSGFGGGGFSGGGFGGGGGGSW
ncbi:MAG: DUF2207 domain-containing protein [Fimbriimonadales bacterium]